MRDLLMTITNHHGFKNIRKMRGAEDGWGRGEKRRGWTRLYIYLCLLSAITRKRRSENRDFRVHICGFAQKRRQRARARALARLIFMGWCTITLARYTLIGRL